MANFGRVGLDVGFFGRWSRLGFGVLILLPILTDLPKQVEIGLSPTFYGQAALYLAVIVIAYTAVYFLLGERFFARANPWINTLILVGPAIVIVWWDVVIAPSSGIELPGPLEFAMFFYVGVSFLLQWKIKYGGCEVVAIPIILLRCRYTTYCIPLVVLDAA